MSDNFERDDQQYLIEQLDPFVREERERREYDAAMERLLEIADQQSKRKRYSLFGRWRQDSSR